MGERSSLRPWYSTPRSSRRCATTSTWTRLNGARSSTRRCVTRWRRPDGSSPRSRARPSRIPSRSNAHQSHRHRTAEFTRAVESKARRQGGRRRRGRLQSPQHHRSGETIRRGSEGGVVSLLQMTTSKKRTRSFAAGALRRCRQVTSTKPLLIESFSTLMQMARNRESFSTGKRADFTYCHGHLDRRLVILGLREPPTGSSDLCRMKLCGEAT